MIRDASAMDRPVAAPRRARLRLALAAGGLVLLLAAVAVLPAARRWMRADKVFALERVRVATVQRGALQRDISTQGRVVAALHPTLFSPAQGIVHVVARAGTAARKGDVLARVDSPERSSRLAQERSSLLALQSDLGSRQVAAKKAELAARQAVDVLAVRFASAERLLARAQASSADGVISKLELEKAQDDVQIGRLELDNARERARLERETMEFDLENVRQQIRRQSELVAEAQRQVDELTLRAPFDGIVATVDVQDRDAVTPNQPVVTIVDLSNFEIEFDLPENYAADVTPGTPAEIRYEQQLLKGRVHTISPEIRDSSVRGTIAFEGPEPEGLRQGLRVGVRLVLEHRADVVKVARGRFLEAGGGRHAYVVEDGVAVRRPIRVGATSIGEVEILEGLEVGDTVVISDTSEFEGASTVLLR